jgi:hypothetical protein
MCGSSHEPVLALRPLLVGGKRAPPSGERQLSGNDRLEAALGPMKLSESCDAEEVCMGSAAFSH